MTTLRFEPVRGGLGDSALAQVAALEAACAVYDQVRLKLEWDSLRARAAGQVSDWICLDRGRLVGFCGLYGFQPGEFELCGMVGPGHRRRGIARTLFTLAVAEARARRPPADRLLVVVDRAHPDGAAFARAMGASYHNSEYSLRVTERPAGPTGLTMRAATLDDADFVARCLAPAFGLHSWTMPDPQRRPITLFLDGDRPVAVIHVAHEAGVARLYGFAVPPDLRGHGLGGRALRLIVGTLLDSGEQAVELEVSTGSDSALSLYLRTGFRMVSTIDYFALPLT